VATVVSYVINTTWSSARLHDRTLVRFMLVSFGGFLLAMFVAWAAQLAGLLFAGHRCRGTDHSGVHLCAAQFLDVPMKGLNKHPALALLPLLLGALAFFW
jgi:putative flippase GtrA